jgi:hypothetical protein
MFHEEGQISYRKQIKEADSSSSIGKSLLDDYSIRDKIIKVKKVKNAEIQKS